MLNRRQFLGTSAAFAAPFLFPGCCSCCGASARKFAANELVNVAVIGYGRIAHTMDVPKTICL